MINYIPQREEFDCGIAALAMACFVSYETVAADLMPDVLRGKGINDLHLKDWLWRNGWAWQEVYRNFPKEGKYIARIPWPPRPFASTHLVQVEATKDWHFVVLDFDGRVYDPWKAERQNLGHPDYKQVSWVMGLWKTINQREAR